MDILSALNNSKMSTYQLRAIAVSTLIYAAEGLDLSILAFALPYIPKGFFDSDAQRGLVLSAALVGMLIGAFAVAPLADRLGRRKIVLMSLSISILGMAGSALTTEPMSLLVFRVITGIGMGAMIACLNVLVQEQASSKNRATVFGIYSAGFGLGSVIGATSALALFSSIGGSWESIFWVATIVSIAVGILAFFFLPESIEFLLANEAKDPRTQQKLDRIIAKLNNPEIVNTARPAVELTTARSGIAGLFANGLWAKTLLIWVVVLGTGLTFWFTQTWTPQLVNVATGVASNGTIVGLALSIGSLVGCITMGLIALKVEPIRFAWLTALLAATSLVLVSFSFGSLGWTFALTLFYGVTTSITNITTSPIAAAIYPVKSRATGIAWISGLTRLASFTAPLLAGFLLTFVSPANLFAFSAIPVAIAGIAAIALSISIRSRPTQPTDLASTMPTATTAPANHT